MKHRFKRVLAAALGMAAATAVVPLVAAPAAYAAPSLQGTADISPNSSTNSNNSFTITLPAGAKCPGDSALDGWRVTSYMVAKTTDPATLTFDSNGPTSPQFGPPQSTFRQPLYDTTGSAYTTGQTANEDPDGSGGPIINLPSFTFSVYDGTNPSFSLPAGQYNVGIACVQPSGTSFPIDRFWNNTITVTDNPSDPGPAKVSWTEGTPADSPTLDSVVPSHQACTANFTPGSSSPADVSYTATAQPGNISATDSTAPFGSITIPGLTNGTPYTITVVANNGVGDSAPSNSMECTPAVTRTNATNVSVSPGNPGDGTATVNWTAPGPNDDSATPTGCEVVINGPTASTTTVPCADETLPLSNLDPGSYTAAVTAKYSDAPTEGTNPPTVPVGFNVAGADLAGPVVQDVTVVRPDGALVLTQVCGVSGEMPAVPGGTYTGFPDELPLVADNGSHVGAPTTDGTAPTQPHGPDGIPGNADDATAPDPNFSEYPYPTTDDGVPNPVYPTHCGLDLNTAQFVTRGDGAGQYFAADGVLNQITVVDTRDVDSGWQITGQVGTLTEEDGDTFDGRQVGWVPQMTEDTGPFTDSQGNLYDQTVAAGGVVHPLSPINNTSDGLSTAKVLGSAAANDGLGIAILDARVLVLIPVTADAGTYNGTLTITAIAP